MNLNVIFLGCTQGYGYAFSACNTKVEFMAKGLTELGASCYIHNGCGGRGEINKPEYRELKGIGTVIDYPTRGNWHVSQFRNYGLLLSDLKKWYRVDMKNWVIVEAPYLPYYYLEIRAAHKAGYKVAVISHEWLGTFQNANKLQRWINHRYADVFGYYVDAILPISEYIIDKIQKFKKPYLKVPIAADFSTEPTLGKKEPFFLYCVSAEYLRVIKIVLEGFKKFQTSHAEYKMVLVLAGGKSAIEATYKVIEGMGIKESVIIKHKIPYKELLHLYETASGLIVPLDPDFEQDEARLSQKIAEYLSSGSPIVSNNVGEVKHYFTNRENIVLDEYTSDGFFNSFSWIADNPEEAVNIGLIGYKLGKQTFDYRICAKQLVDFFNKI